MSRRTEAIIAALILVSVLTVALVAICLPAKPQAEILPPRDWMFFELGFFNSPRVEDTLVWDKYYEAFLKCEKTDLTFDELTGGVEKVGWHGSVGDWSIRYEDRTVDRVMLFMVDDTYYVILHIFHEGRKNIRDVIYLASPELVEITREICRDNGVHFSIL